MHCSGGRPSRLPCPLAPTFAPACPPSCLFLLTGPGLDSQCEIQRWGVVSLSAGPQSWEPQPWRLITPGSPLSSAPAQPRCWPVFPLCQPHLLPAWLLARCRKVCPRLELSISVSSSPGRQGRPEPMLLSLEVQGEVSFLGGVLATSHQPGPALRRSQSCSPYHLSCLPMTPKCPSQCPPFPSCGFGA